MNHITTPAAPNARSIPSTYTDRASLSEAWYRALYGSRSGVARAAAAKTQAAASAKTQTSARIQPRSDAISNAAPNGSRLAFNAASSREHQSSGTVNAFRVRSKTTTPSSPAQRMWRAAIARRTSLRIELEQGKSIQILVQQRGRTVHVLTLADRATAVRAQAALSRARVALLLAGVRVTTASRVLESGSISKGES